MIPFFRITHLIFRGAFFRDPAVFVDIQQSPPRRHFIGGQFPGRDQQIQKIRHPGGPDAFQPAAPEKIPLKPLQFPPEHPVPRIHAPFIMPGTVFAEKIVRIRQVRLGLPDLLFQHFAFFPKGPDTPQNRRFVGTLRKTPVANLHQRAPAAAVAAALRLQPECRCRHPVFGKPRRDPGRHAIRLLRRQETESQPPHHIRTAEKGRTSGRRSSRNNRHLLLCRPLKKIISGVPGCLFCHTENLLLPIRAKKTGDSGLSPGI